MSNKNSNINWPEIMEKFAKHEGSIIDFCRSNNLTQSQLYNQRKKLKKKKGTQVFHVFEVPSAEPVELCNENEVDSTIKIEIGKAKIFLPACDKNTLLTLVRELAQI